MRLVREVSFPHLVSAETKQIFLIRNVPLWEIRPSSLSARGMQGDIYLRDFVRAWLASHQLLINWKCAKMGWQRGE